MKTLPGIAIGLTLALSLAAAGILTARSNLQDAAAMGDMLAQNRPGPEHEGLAALAGNWDAALIPPGTEKPAGTGRAQARALLGGRFLDVEFTLDEGEFRYTLGFDRRHGEYSLILIDSTDTYAVTARGPAVDGLIRMSGVDDDPYMASLGFEKKFAFDLELTGADEFALKLHFVDTRKQPEVLLEAYTHRFTRR